MKTTIMEYGLILITAMLAAFFLSGFQLLVDNSGNLKEFIVNYINSIC